MFSSNYKGKRQRQGVSRSGLISVCEVQINRASRMLISTIYRCRDELCSRLYMGFKYHTVYSIIFFNRDDMFSISGGAICRGAALHFSRMKGRA